MMITAEEKTKYYKGTNRTATYIYYRCTKKSKIIKCSQPFIRQELLDSQLSNLIQTVSLRKDWADKMLLKLDEDEKNVAQSSFAFVQSKKEEIKVINIKLQFLLDSYLDQVIDRQSYLKKKSDLMSQKKTLEEQILSFEQKQNNWLEPMRTWVKEAANAANIVRGDILNVKKVLALKIFGSNLIVENKRVDGEALSPWAALRAAPTSRDWEPKTGIEPVA